MHIAPMTKPYGDITEIRVIFEHFSLPALREVLEKDRCDCHNLPDIWTYEMLRFWVTLKLNWFLQVTKCQIDRFHQLPLCGFAYIGLEYYSFKAEVSKSLSDVHIMI